jgi:cold shock CspA family protein
MSKRDYGQIIFWADDKNYGFVRRDAGERDVFVHRDEFDVPAGEDIRIGDRVSYVVGADQRNGKPPRICAKSVRLLADEEPTESGGAQAGMYKSEQPTNSAIAEQLRNYASNNGESQ